MLGLPDDTQAEANAAAPLAQLSTNGSSEPAAEVGTR